MYDAIIFKNNDYYWYCSISDRKNNRYEKWREQHAVALRQVSEESSAKIQALEDEKNKKTEVCFSTCHL